MVIVNAKIAKCMHAIALAICKLCYSCIYDPAWYCIALVSSAAMHPMHAVMQPFSCRKPFDPCSDNLYITTRTMYIQPILAATVYNNYIIQ